MQLKVCLFLLGFVGGCVAFADLPPPPEAETGDDSLYVCYTTVACPRGTEYNEKFKECTKSIVDQDFEIALEFLDKDAQISQFVDYMDALHQKYCVLPPEPRMKGLEARESCFCSIGGKSIEWHLCHHKPGYFGTGTKGLLQLCLAHEIKKERFKKVLSGTLEIYSDCVMELIEEVQMDLKCDIKDYDAQFE